MTITGGKWTTVRKMAEDCVDRVLKELGDRRPCTTTTLRLHQADPKQIDAIETERPEFTGPIHPKLEVRRSRVIWAVRHEMARTVEDFLARRTRALFLNQKAAVESAPVVAELMASELGRDEDWVREQIDAFDRTASHYAAE